MEPPDHGRLARLARWCEPGQGEPDRSLPMEGLRGIAVALVFLVHYAAQLEAAFGLRPPAAGQALAALGHGGVDLFFVLSGCLIYASLLRREPPYGSFLRRRVQRIYPTFLVVLALQLVALLLSSSGGQLPRETGELALLLLANLALLPGLFDIRPILVVAWTLSYEMAFYAALPLLLAGLRLRHWPRTGRVALLLGAVLAMQLWGWEHRRMGMFGCGMLLVEFLAGCGDRLRRARWLDVLALAALPPVLGVLLAAGLESAAGFAALFLGCFLVCAAAFARPGPVARGLALRPLRWLGNISYSYYLLHGLVLAALFVALRPATPLIQAMGAEAAYWLLLPPAFLLTVVVSVPLYLLVERPWSILPATRQGGARQAGALAGA